MFKFRKLILFFSAYFIIIVNIAAKYIPAQECAHPKICISILECPYFEAPNGLIPFQLQRKTYHNLFKKNYCGIINGSIRKVCCNKSEIPITSSVQLQLHRNFHKLPMDICGYVGPFSKRITNGIKAAVEEFPWMALIAYNEPDVGIVFHCGGTIISEKFILTAAHCTKYTIIGVRLGEYELKSSKLGQDPPDCDSTGYCSPKVQDIPIKKVIVHPEYNQKTSQNDIALIELSESANFTYSNVKPICLPIITESNDDLSGKFAVVSGWGHTENNERSSVLMKASLKVLSNSDCKQIYKSDDISSNQICAGGNKGRDACFGDSGGPLMIKELIDETERYLQYGIISLGPTECGTEGKPGIYTRIRNYLKWILDNIGD